MKLNELLVLEKRRNPALPAQTKRAGIEELLKYEGRDDIFISYTDVDKIGINPQSEYYTPIGIYAYPLANVLPELKERMDSKRVPFAGRRPFIWVLQANPVSLQDYDSGDFDRDLGKLVDYMKKLGFDSTEIATIPNDAIRKATIESIAGKMWNVTRMMARAIAKKTNTKAPVRWNRLMSDVLGYQGIVDHGDGIIHSNESNQAVFFNKKTFKVVEKIRNISPRVSDHSSDEYIIGHIKNGKFNRAWLKNPSEAVQLALVEKDGPAGLRSLRAIGIDNPSEQVQIAAVKQYGKAIIDAGFIKNPSDTVKKLANVSY